MDDYSDGKGVARRRNVRILSIVKGFHGGVARYTAMLSKLNARPGIEFQTIVINSRGWLCNREDLDAYDLREVMIRGRTDFSWIEPCVNKMNSFSPDLLFVHGGCVAGGLAWMLQRRLRQYLPYISSYHGLYHAPRPNRKLFEIIINFFTPFVYQHRALGIVAVADYCKKHLVSRGVDAAKIRVVHNGIDPNPPRFRAISRSSLGIKEHDVILGTTSRLDPVKGLSYLIDAISVVIREHPRAHLVVVGDGKCARQLQQKCQQLGIRSNVHFVGYQNDVHSWLNVFDVFVLPSLEEYHSISLLEAMRIGKTIVATDVGGNTESVRDGKEALVVPSKNAEALVKALRHLLEDRTLAERLSEAAQKRFYRYFTIDRMLDETETWLSDCVQLSKS